MARPPLSALQPVSFALQLSTSDCLSVRNPGRLSRPCRHRSGRAQRSSSPFIPSRAHKRLAQTRFLGLHQVPALPPPPSLLWPAVSPHPQPPNMSWFASLFSNKNTRSNSRRTMTSTHEAFSLPTSSPNHFTHPDAFNGEALATAQYGPSASYSYPPSSPSGPYYEVPHSYVST